MGRRRALEVEVFKNVLHKEELDTLLVEAKDKLKGARSFGNSTNTCVEFENEELAEKIQRHLFKKLNVTTYKYQMQYQCWQDGEKSDLHVHDDFNRSLCDYNTLIYLNDDFDGGEFYTLDFIHKPKTGDVTFFNGETTWHGVKPIRNNDRYTIIIWWYNTTFN